MKFTAENKFEFDKDMSSMTITLRTFDAVTVLRIPKDYSLRQFAQLYDFFLDYSVSVLPKTMGEIARSIPGACIMSELKPGLIYDDRHQPEMFMNRSGQMVNRDRWSDGMTWEEWSSEAQALKESHTRRKHWAEQNKKRQLAEEDERPMLDDDWTAPVREERKFTYEPKPEPKKNVDKNMGDLLDGLFD